MPPTYPANLFLQPFEMEILQAFMEVVEVLFFTHTKRSIVTTFHEYLPY